MLIQGTTLTSAINNSDSSATSTLTAQNTNATWDVSGYTTAALFITGSWSGSAVSVWGSVDGTNYVALRYVDTQTGSVTSLSGLPSGNYIGQINIAGYSRIAFLTLAGFSGSTSITLRFAQGTVSTASTGGGTSNVSVTSSVLPTGAATETTLSALKSVFLNSAITSATISGTYAGQTVTVPVSTISAATFLFEASGLYVNGNYLFVDGTLDGSSWFPLPLVNLKTGAATSTLPNNDGTNIGIIACSVVGLTQVRLRNVSSQFAFAGNGTIFYGFSEKVVAIPPQNGIVLAPLPSGTNQIGGVSLPPRSQYFYNLSQSGIMSSGTILVPYIDGSQYSQIVYNATSLGTGQTVLVQYSLDAGVTWTTQTAISTTGNASIVLSSSYIYRIVTGTAGTAGTFTFSAFGTLTGATQSYLDNPAPAIIPFSSAATFAQNAVLVGPFYCGNYRSGSILISSASTGMALQVQFSYDGINYASASVWLGSGTFSQATNMGVASTLFLFSTFGALYCRVITSAAITAGTSTFTLSLTTTAGPTPALSGVSIIPTSAVGATPTPTTSSLVAAATTNLVSAKASGTSTTITSIWGFAKTGVTNYLKIFNTGTVNLGVTAPVLNIPLNGNVSYNCGLGGIRLNSGFSYAITLNAAPLDATAVAAAGDSVINIVYV